MQRHVEIAGGGIAGLNAAIVLARRGWSVRVHERAPEIRETGAGIFLRKNSIDVLEAFGALPDLARQGVKIATSRIADRNGQVLQEFDVTPSRLYCVPRQSLVEVLAETARGVGVAIELSSAAVAAEPDGVLVLESGSRLRADLVIAADGFNSSVRRSIIPEARCWELSAAVTRHFVPTRDIAREPVTTQHWSGQRRVGVTPTSPTHTYVYTVCHSSDRAACAQPLNVENWVEAFPSMRRDLEIIAEAPATQYRYHMVACPRWHVGRVAVIGDAAHGLPPTLGQGAGLAVMNAYAMAECLGENIDVPEALAQWERRVRFVSDLTQKWSCRYDWFTRQWPSSLEFMRPLIFWAFRRIPPLNDRMRLAERGLQAFGFAVA